MGLSKGSSDYTLFNIDLGKTIELQFSQSRNEITNGCSKGRAAHYDAAGRPNFDHYDWSITWQHKAYGAVAVVKGVGLPEVNVTRWSAGVRIKAFKTGAGIQYFEATALPDGALEIDANWSFTKHPVLLSEVLSKRASS